MKSVLKFAPLLVAIFVMTANSAVSGQEEGSGTRTFFVKVQKADAIVGQVIEVSELNVTTAFGDVTIPMDKIEAVKVNASTQGTAVIAFTNGDMVTGSLDLSELHLKTSWGKAHINANAIDSFSTSQFGRFYTDTNGGGWRYSRGTAANNRSRTQQPTTNRNIQNTFNRGG